MKAVFKTFEWGGCFVTLYDFHFEQRHFCAWSRVQVDETLSGFSGQVLIIDPIFLNLTFNHIVVKFSACNFSSAVMGSVLGKICYMLRIDLFQNYVWNILKRLAHGNTHLILNLPLKKVKQIFTLKWYENWGILTAFRFFLESSNSLYLSISLTSGPMISSFTRFNACISRFVAILNLNNYNLKFENKIIIH